jgi:hypothetical protein
MAPNFRARLEDELKKPIKIQKGKQKLTVTQEAAGIGELVLLKATIVLGVILSSFVISSKSISLTVKRFKARSRTLCPLRMKRYLPTL